MAHTKYDDLKDLGKELEVIRVLAGLKEKSPGVFYYKSSPFLHFHHKDQVRWADVKINNSWIKLDIPFSANQKTKTTFLKAVTKAHQELL